MTGDRQVYHHLPDDEGMGTTPEPPSPRERKLRTATAVSVATAILAVSAAAVAVIPGASATCTSASGLTPDRGCTPGLVLTSSKRKVCTSGYAQTVRHVTEGTKRRVEDAYGFDRSQAHEIDHLVPLSLGGSNDQQNLWPEPAPAFHVKDRLEFAAWRGVCAGRLKLADVQRQFASDWTTVKVPALPTPQVTIP